MKYLIYARVSPRGSDFDGETSIQMQIDMCRKQIESSGDEVVSVIFDEFYSGKTLDRPGMNKILGELRNGTAKWDAICFYKMSRLSRNQRDSVNFLAELAEHGKGFLSITEKYDYSTPIGRAMLGVMQVINQLEREQTSENTRNKMISIAARGLCPYGNPPHGYKRGEKGDNQLYVDPREAEEIKDIFQMYASSKYTMQDIQKRYRGFSKQSILNILRNQTYLGKIVYAGQIYPGKHPAIISEELFRRVQEILPRASRGKISRPKSQRRKYLLSGLLRCHCGRYMSPASAKSGRYFYYECTDDLTCKNRVRAEYIELEALNQLRHLNHKIDFRVIQAGLAEAEQRRLEYINSLRPDLENCKEALRQAEREREKIIQLMLNGQLTDVNVPLFNARLESASKEVDHLTDRLKNLQIECNSIGYDPERAILFIREIETLADLMARLPDDFEKQRRILVMHIKEIAEQPDGSFRFYFNFEPLNSSTICQLWLRQLDSNQRPSG